MAQAAEDGGAFLAIYLLVATALLLGALASAAFVPSRAKRWTIGAVLCLAYLALLSWGDNYAGTIDLMFRTFLFMFLVMPIPFAVAFLAGLGVRHLLNRGPQRAALPKLRSPH